MIKRTAPPVRDFGRLEFPAVNEESIIGADGYVVPFHFLIRGEDPVCRLSVVWKKPGAPERTAEDVIMSKMLREGCNGYTGSQIEDVLDFNGAWMTVENNYSYIALNTYCISRRIPDILPVIREIVSNPTFPNTNLQRIKDKEIDIIRIQNLKVSYVAEKGLYKLLLGKDNPHSHIISAEEVEKVGRSQLSASFNRLIMNNSPGVWLAGNVDGKVMSLIREFCADMKGRKTSWEREHHISSEKSGQSVQIAVKNASQCAVYMGLSYTCMDPMDYLGLKIAAMVLGGYFGSRLNRLIREDKGLTYGINASVLRIPEGAIFRLSAHATRGNIDKIIELAKSEIRKMSESEVDRTELEDVRRYMISSLANMAESPFNLLETFIGLEADGLSKDFLMMFQDRILTITPAEIKEISMRYLKTDALVSVVAGNI